MKGKPTFALLFFVCCSCFVVFSTIYCHILEVTIVYIEKYFGKNNRNFLVCVLCCEIIQFVAIWIVCSLWNRLTASVCFDWKSRFCCTGKGRKVLWAPNRRCNCHSPIIFAPTFIPQWIKLVNLCAIDCKVALFPLLLMENIRKRWSTVSR